MPILHAFDVDNERLADSLREIADGIDEGKLAVVKVTQSETADADNPAIKESIEVTYSVDREDGPIRPLEYVYD